MTSFAADCVNILEDEECERLAAVNRCVSDYSNMLDVCFRTCSRCDEKSE